MRRWILPRSRLRLARRECADDRRASVGLRDDHVRERDVLRQPSSVAHFLEHLPHADQPSAAACRVDDMRRQRPAELLGELDAHRLLPLDAVRLAQGRDIEVAGRRGECARLFASIADVAGDQLQIGAERADRVEDRLRRRVGRVHANGNSGRRCVRGERGAGVARRRHDEAGTPSPRARVTAALIPRALNDAVGLRPSSFTQSRATPISRANAGSSCSGVSPSPSDTGVSPCLSGSTGAYRHMSHRGVIACARRHWRIITNEKRLPAGGQTVASASPDSRTSQAEHSRCQVLTRDRIEEW